MVKKSKIHNLIYKQEGIEQSKLKKFLFFYKIYYLKQIGILVLWLAVPPLLHAIMIFSLVIFSKRDAIGKADIGDFLRDMEEVKMYSLKKRLIAYLIPTLFIGFVMLGQTPGPLMNFYY